MADNVTKIDKVEPGSNGFEKSVQSAVERVEEVQANIDEIMENARAEASPLRDDIKEIKREAVDDLGITRKVLNAKISARRLMRKADSRRDNLDEEHQDEFDRISRALGDFITTPLGEATVAAAE